MASGPQQSRHEIAAVVEGLVRVQVDEMRQRDDVAKKCSACERAEQAYVEVT